MTLRQGVAARPRASGAPSASYTTALLLVVPTSRPTKSSTLAIFSTTIHLRRYAPHAIRVVGGCVSLDAVGSARLVVNRSPDQRCRGFGQQLLRCGQFRYRNVLGKVLPNREE